MHRVYRVELSRNKCKPPFGCTVSILQVYFTHLCYKTFWALEHPFKEKNVLKLIYFSLNQFLDHLAYIPELISIQQNFYFTFPNLFQHKLYKK